jgi:proteasome lid subunit RPN8/RPN11
VIPPRTLVAVYAHARAALPAECCGYLRGVTLDEVVACTNELASATGFSIAGAELLAFVRTFDSPRPARVVYHSHPNGRAYFSETDRAAAATPAGPIYPVQHLVVGVTETGVAEAALFAWADDAHDFVEIARFDAKVSS